MNQFLKQTEEIITSPVHKVMLLGGKAYGNTHPDNPSEEAVIAEIGTIIQKEHFKVATGYPDVKMLFDIQEVYAGFWQQSACATVVIFDDFQGEMPAWQMVLQGRFSPEVIERRDVELAHACCQLIEEAANPIRTDVDLRHSVYSPRPISYDTDVGSYVSECVGSWDKLHGRESVMLEGKEVWSASFMVTTLIGKNSPPEQ